MYLSLRPLLVLALLVGLGSAATAQVSYDQGRTCAAPTPTEAEAAATAAAVQEWLATHDYDAERGGEIVTIPVAFHVVSGGSTVSLGNIPDEWIEDQMDVLNDAFLDLGYQFVLAITTRTENPDWYFGLDSGTAQESQMKQTLGLDPAVFMNVYTARLAGGLLGWAYFPGPGAETSPIQGVVLLDQSLPGGSAAPYNLGDTGTHEVGHYVGLYHTFQGGCTGSGDQVDDTPAEASPAFGCPVGRDSCPDDPGEDPIYNFMDYTDDACMEEFTPGQAERAWALMSQYRPTIMANSGAFVNPEDLAFGDVNVGESGALEAIVVNLSDTDLEITDISTDNDVFTTEITEVTVPAGSAVAIEVTFTPEADVIYEGTLTLETDDAEVGTLTVMLDGGGLLAGALGFDEPGILAQVEEGSSTTETLTLTNAGPGSLTYAFAGFSRIGSGQATPPRPNAGLTVSPAAKGAADGASGAPVRSGEGGPDEFGYTWIDSDEPGGPDYDWVDISGTGTALSLDDDAAQSVTLPFAFPFYGETYSSVNVVSNGFLNFGASSTAYTNAPIGDPSAPNNLIAPFWDDLDPTSGGTVYYEDLGDGRFVVQWDGVPPYSGSGTATFQAILHAGGQIVFQYEDVSMATTSATIGIENADASIGLEVAYNAAYVEDGLAVLISAAPSWITGVSPASGTIEAEGEQEVEVTLDAAELEPGVYQQLLDVLSNDPVQPSYRVHVVLGVGDVLPPPALLAPAYGEQEVPVQLVLAWTPVPDAESYDLEIALDEEFDDIVFSGSFEGEVGTFVADADIRVYWRVRSVSGDETSEWSLPFSFRTSATVDSESESAPPARFALGNAYPNPTQGSVTVPFTLEEAMPVSLQVYDLAGRRVAVVAAETTFSAGEHTLRWDSGALPNGVYLLRLTAGGQTATERLVVVR